MPVIPNRSGLPIKREQIAPSRRVDVDEIEDTLTSQQNQINQKANASTVGGLATAVNSKASQSSVDALAGTVAGKADAAALASKADASALAAKANSADVATALASKADAAALATKANASDVSTALAAKANVSDVGTALAAKADASALAAKANTADLPLPADIMPKSEATTAAKGSEQKRYALEDHQHPRLTSTTKATIASGSTVAVAFTRTFVNKPGITCTEEPPDTGTMSSNPATFRVESWVREVMTPTPSGAYTGCVIKVWRSRPLPTMTPLTIGALLTAVVTGVNALITALTNYDIFGASAVGTTFSCIAIQRSDVA